MCSNVYAAHLSVTLGGCNVLSLQGLVPPPPGVGFALGIGSYRGQIAITAMVAGGCEVDPQELVNSMHKWLWNMDSIVKGE